VIVLDTHAFVWWREENSNLSSRARRTIESAERIAVPTACCFEIASLERRGRIRLDRGAAAWLRAALSAPGIEPVSLTAEIATEAGRLPDTFPGDPIDRVVYATATSLGSKIVTRDRRIAEHDPSRVVW
jgi:PIN domain nuclease of toxin-antitoxin system